MHKIEIMDQDIPIVVNGETYKISLEEFNEVATGCRPKGMKFDIYKEARKKAKQIVKTIKRGKLEHVSKVSNSAWRQFLKDNDIKYTKQKGHTYIKKENEVL